MSLFPMSNSKMVGKLVTISSGRFKTLSQRVTSSHRFTQSQSLIYRVQIVIYIYIYAKEPGI